jgi:hypothetical protein
MHTLNKKSFIASESWCVVAHSEHADALRFHENALPFRAAHIFQ